MYSFDSRVRYSECDESGELSIHGLVNYLQDCSTFHSESLGVGLDHMASEHYAWLISAWEIEIARLPRFGEKIRISTWCHEMRGGTGSPLLHHRGRRGPKLRPGRLALVRL